MAYDMRLSDRVREFLAENLDVEIEEKEMFGVLNFIVNKKTCICVNRDKLMLRFNPDIQEELSKHRGYETMLMKGKEYKGYCYINPEGFTSQKDFQYLLNLCLEFNSVLNQKSARSK